MFNFIALLLGLYTALCPVQAEKPAAKIAASPADNRIVRTPPRADERSDRENGYRARYFDMTDYEQNKQNLDEKYSRRSYLREKMAKEIADFLADYEEYEILTRNYRRELYETGNRADIDNPANDVNNQNSADNSSDENRRENGDGSYDNSGNSAENGNSENGGNRSGNDNRTGNGGISTQPGKVYIPAPPETNRPRPLIPGDENREDPGSGQKVPSPSDLDDAYLIRD